VLEDQSERSIALVPIQPLVRAVGVPPVVPTLPEFETPGDPGLEPINLSASARHERPFPDTTPPVVAAVSDADPARPAIWGSSLASCSGRASWLRWAWSSRRGFLGSPQTQSHPPASLATVSVAAEPVIEAPQAPAPVLAKVRVNGDARTVKVQANGTSYRLPAAVPAGVYEVVADFGDGAAVVGDVTVPMCCSVLVRCLSAWW